MGSAVSIAVGLIMTLIIFFALPEHADRLAEEFAPLSRALGLTLILSAVAALSFYGELRLRTWRPWAHLALVGWMGALGAMVWPTG